MTLLAQPVNRAILTSLLETIHMYNLLPYNFVNTGVAVLACNLFNGALCNLVMQMIADADPKIDDTSRYDVYMSNLPAGAGYKNYLHYAQGIARKTDCFLRYDYGKNENLKRYGTEVPPSYNLANLDFPIAIMNGSEDKMADPKDVAWLVPQLKNVIFSHEYYLGHMSFAIAKTMDWFTVDVMAILNHYNGKCDASTMNSNFTEGNLKCMFDTGMPLPDKFLF